MVSFDYAESFAAKGKYIKENGLRGLATLGGGVTFVAFFLILSSPSLRLLDTIYTPTPYSTLTAFPSSFVPSKPSVTIG